MQRPCIAGMRMSTLVVFHRWHLRAHAAQDLLAGAGIAVGVALFFGVLTANSSLIGSASESIRAIDGRASLEVVARSPEGFDESLATSIGALPGVKVAAPLLRESAEVIGHNGRRPVQLVGLTAKQLELGASATADLGAEAIVLERGLGVTSSVAGEVGAHPQQAVTLATNGEYHKVTVPLVLDAQTVGALASDPIVVSSLGLAQQLTGMPQRVTQVLVEPVRGHERAVERELRTIAAGRLDVAPATHELAVLEASARPTTGPSSMFSAMLGFLFAVGAVMLILPERRRLVYELRQLGYRRRQILTILVSHATVLGLTASLAGVALGDALWHSLFHEVPSYLTVAFPIGSHPVVPLHTILLTIGCGVAATVAASLLPMLDLRSHRRSDESARRTVEAHHRLRPRTIATSGLAGAVLALAVSALVLAAPGLSIVAGLVLALATFWLVLPLYDLVIRGLKPASERMRRSMLPLALVELRETAARSVALAGIVAVAVYGMLTVQGARSDLVTGLDVAVRQYLDTADIWVTADQNFLTIDGFHAGGAAASIARAPGVSSVREYQGALLDVGTRRLWIRARPSGDQTMIQSSELLEGNLAQATRRLREGGWAAVSQGFAKERHVRIGGTLELATPSGEAPLRVAAITTNAGWPAGAITVDTSDFRRYWHTDEPTAIEVNLKAGVGLQAGKRAVERALGQRPGLRVETLTEREAHFQAGAREGIQSLTQLATLLLLATALAIALALGSAIVQRRGRLTSLKSSGFDSDQIWRALLIECAVLAAVGCVDGVVLGVCGHALASRWLRLSVGFPAPFAPGANSILVTLAVVLAIAVGVMAFPAFAVSRLQSRPRLRE